MEMTPDKAQIAQAFFPYAFGKQMAIRAVGKRFVHYTSAKAAFSILRNHEVWMRKSSVMNDFMEIEHGLDCLYYSYNGDNGDKFRSVVEGLFPGVAEEMQALFNSWVPHFRLGTYITCMSEHEDSEDEIGRLSMWRAYGGQTGVAIVVNTGAFLTPSDALKAYTSPVAYLSREEFKELADVPEEGLVGVSIAELVNRLIIGPTQYPVAMREAFVGLLEEAGVDGASLKVWASDIPLRTS